MPKGYTYIATHVSKVEVRAGTVSTYHKVIHEPSHGSADHRFPVPLKD